MRRKTRGGRYERHSPEELQWARDTFSRITALNQKIGDRVFEQLDSINEFKTKFRKTISAKALYSWLRSVGGLSGRGGAKKNLVSMLRADSTKYLLITNGIPVIFSSSDQLKQSLEDPQLTQAITDVKLFAATPITIHRKTTVAIGEEARVTK